MRSKPLRTLTQASLAAHFLFVTGLLLYLASAVFVPYFYSSLRERVLGEVLILPPGHGSGPSRGTTEPRGRFFASNETLSVYLYNVTNVDDVHRRGAKPLLSRLGPYVFVKRTDKVDVHWSDDYRMVSYRENVSHTFLPEHSAGTLDDELATVNVPLLGVLEAVIERCEAGKLPCDFLQYVAGLVERWQGVEGRIDGIFMRRSVGEVLDGYTDGLLEVVAGIPGLGIRPIDPTFGLMMDRIDEERSAVWTGYGDGVSAVKDVGQLHAWRGLREVVAYGEKVRGTGGRQFAAGIGAENVADIVDQDDESIYTVWVGDAYRAFELKPRKSQVEIGGVENVKVKRLTADSGAFAASDRYQQIYRGLLNITRPVNNGAAGVQLFLSLPGFCGVVDDVVVGGVDGVVCSCSFEGGDGHGHGDDADCLEKYIHLDMEPLTGLIVQAQKSLMLSTYIGPRYGAVSESRVNEAFVPIMEVVEFGVGTAKELKDVRNLQRVVGISVLCVRYLPWVSWLMIAGGLLAILASLSNGEEEEGDAAYEAGEYERFASDACI